MKKILFASLITFIFFACNSGGEKQDVVAGFELTGDVAVAPDMKVLLERVSFDGSPPRIADTAQMQGGKFTMHGPVGDEYLFQVRFGESAGARTVPFINDGKSISMNGRWDAFNDIKISGSPATERYMAMKDSLKHLQGIITGQIKPTEGVSRSDMISQYTKIFSAYTKGLADHDPDPVVSFYATGMVGSPDPETMIETYEALKQRFPNHKPIQEASQKIQDKMKAAKVD